VTSGQPAWEQGGQPLPKDGDWLLPFLPHLRVHGPRIVEIGCGPGRDAATLATHGFEVTAFDRASLQRAREQAPAVRLLRADLGQTLPFRSGSFDAAASSLALHYLPWAKTRAAFSEIHRVLRHGAPFLFRVNATDDYNHGASEGEELEPNFRRMPTAHYAETKRFFDEVSVRDAVADLFRIQHLEHKTIYRYANPKQVWECLAVSL